MYFAIIGDIIDSKSISNRFEVQQKLTDLLNEINRIYSDHIAANFIITLGDEFQGLLYSSENLFKIIDIIKLKMYPVRIRFGVGIGEISTNINRQMAIGADGPAYHYARNMIDEIKHLENIQMSTSIDTRIYSNQKSDIITLINVNLNLCNFIENNWTPKQRDIIHMIILSNKTQREIASEVGVAQSSIQRRLKTSGYYDYIKAKEIINNILMEF